MYIYIYTYVYIYIASFFNGLPIPASNAFIVACTSKLGDFVKRGGWADEADEPWKKCFSPTANGMNLCHDLVVVIKKAELGGGLKYFLMFIPKIGEMIQFDEHIFFRWVETTSQFKTEVWAL